MNRILLSSSILGFLIFWLFGCEKNSKITKPQIVEGRYEQEWLMMRDLATNVVPRERIILADNIRAARAASRTASMVSLEPNWTERGPSNVGGRTRAILIDAADTTDNTVFAGGVGGGLWYTDQFKSSNPNWLPIDDFFENIAISCIAQDPSNSSIIYFGTGEGWYNIDAIRGLGIWKSTNGGSTWSRLNSTNTSTFHYVNDIEVRPNGHIFASTRIGGVMRSTDGGNTWINVLNGDENNAHDIEIGPTGDVWASFSSGQVFFSSNTNGSNTGNSGYWTEKTPGAGYSRIEIAVDPSNANKVIALCQGNSSNDVTGIYTTTDAGSTWTSRPIPTISDQTSNSVFTRSQAWYDLIAGIDPTSGNIVIGGIDALRSSDFGATWTQISIWSLYDAYCCGFNYDQYVHADHHEVVFLPHTPQAAILGTDGGLFYTTNINATSPSFTAKNTGYNVTQFYALAMHPNSGSNYFLAGAQDNGTQKFSSAGLNETTQASGGDGAFCHIDLDNPNIQITSYVFNNYYLSTNGGSSFSSISGGNNEGRFINSTDYDSRTNILYAGDTDDYMTLIKGVGSTNTISRQAVNLSGGYITAVTVDTNSTNRIWVSSYGNSTGKLGVVKIDSAHTSTPLPTFYQITTGISSFGYVSSIEIENGNSNHLLVTLSNFGVNSIWETTNGGTTWTSVDGDLPDMPVRWATFHPDNGDKAFIATELGVWATNDLNGSSTAWSPVNNSTLPNTRVDMLQLRKSDRVLAAATHGRGLFTGVIPTSSTDLVQSGTIASGTYSASNSITSTGTIASSANVTYTAGNYILLQPPFTVQAGALFTATLGSFARIPFTPLTYAHIPIRQPIGLDPGDPIQIDKNDFVFNIYPNPTAELLNLEWDFSDNSQTSIQIMGSTGQLLKTIANQSFNSGFQRIEINISDFKPGVYFIVLKNNNQSKVETFIKI
jgi:photosystem II stability/assembly factor-like uncharacterized protein